MGLDLFLTVLCFSLGACEMPEVKWLWHPQRGQLLCMTPHSHGLWDQISLRENWNKIVYLNTMDTDKDNSKREQSKAIYSEFVKTRESASVFGISCVRETQRQGVEWRNLKQGQKGRLQVHPDRRLHGEAAAGLTTVLPPRAQVRLGHLAIWVVLSWKYG